ncbi:hypothetical protein [Shewanella phaeophyticola]|uniref:Uncharacterized protein n=1 Tax=Shewanella phaeophyticola TaxID=2978345 RepID=A0ABT2NZC5_9GAMM|nr:hypothetical protein [Shewanella sp. KJ10-1]MCT8985741.1 hypothetical protein [Shewanella sp. KJ10-1]
MNQSVSRLALEITRLLYLGGQKRYDHQTEYAKAISLSYQIDKLIQDKFKPFADDESYFTSIIELSNFVKKFEHSNRSLLDFSCFSKEGFSTPEKLSLSPISHSTLIELLNETEHAGLVTNDVLEKAITFI